MRTHIYTLLIMLVLAGFIWIATKVHPIYIIYTLLALVVIIVYIVIYNILK